MALLDERTLLSNTLDFGDFDTLGRYLAAGNSSITYLGKTIDSPRQKNLKPSTQYYFKANHTRGIDISGATDEARGSCEDVAEVLSYFTLKAFRDKTSTPVLSCAPYDFAEMISKEFRQLIFKDTKGLVQSDRLYGCITQSALEPGDHIIHGNQLLSRKFEGDNVYRSSNHTLANYSQTIKQFKEQFNQTNSSKIITSPACERELANILFFDYFSYNTDRHCKNINFRVTQSQNNQPVFLPMQLIDNGAAFSLQSINCYKRYEELSAQLNKEPKGKFSTCPFERSNDFFVGKECFTKEEDIQNYDNLSNSQQLVLLMANSRILFNDFKNLFLNLDFKEGFNQMYYNTNYDKKFLPNLQEIACAGMEFRKQEISESMAQYLNIEFNQELYDENPTYYLDCLEQHMQQNNVENNTTLHIASDEEIKVFNETVLAQTSTAEFNQ